MAKKSDVVRPGIVVGEVLTLADFCFRVGLDRYGWTSLLRRSTQSGHSIAFKQGRRLYVDTAAWVEFMKASSGKRGAGRSGQVTQ